MSIDLNRLSARELDSLIEKAKKRRTILGKRKPAATVRRKLVALAKAEGYGIDELFGESAPATAGRKRATRKAGAKKAAKKATKRGARKAAGKATKKKAVRKAATRKVAPKYRNPANAKDTWTGRGRQPRWLAALTAKGHKPEEFLIRQG